jgi:hypothetical protein
MPSLKKYVRVHDIVGVGPFAGREELLAAVSRHFNLEVGPPILPFLLSPTSFHPTPHTKRHPCFQKHACLYQGIEFLLLSKPIASHKWHKCHFTPLSLSGFFPVLVMIKRFNTSTLYSNGRKLIST